MAADRVLEGRTALVTGGSANLGKAFATALAEDGANVMVHYNSDSKRDQAEQVAQELAGKGVKTATQQGDLTRVAEVAGLVDATIARFGQWDILVNTAGMIVRKPIEEFTEDEWDRMFAVNAKIPFFLMREAATKMADHGRVLNLITTIVAVTAPTYGGYAGSKSPVEHYTKAFAKEVGGRGITVNCVAPGPLKTSFFYPAETDENIAWLKSMSINGDIGDPADVVPVVRFLASPAAKWVTAQTVYVNGGLVGSAS
ncbi:short-chain dehydrogenase [Streptomyces eurocidicus]|uniref:NAD(P)-dependent dehydrogenase (Short-subunit alcohol dehydrogenase family) n=1 Tax=Streptomyces eurocidicus TaxID=66423 RepID=A0A2N8NV34_STREU|nr:SDR family oxidoreductase [Streptomyces eurocidicus]MBB5122489.1 NAD(P)-dependent dehydrogenase (short-subunit alcohol dehydrogenase family) [Streptomyces eurocidicus]PNE32648.1 short-chain dehydrogenase [Streptomyces eurocidicus]